MGPFLLLLALSSASSPAWAACTYSPADPAASIPCLVSELEATQTELADLQSEHDELQSAVQDLRRHSVPGLADFVSANLATRAVTFTGANVYVTSRSGATDGPVDGTGNFIVG